MVVLTVVAVLVGVYQMLLVDLLELLFVLEVLACHFQTKSE